MPSGAEILRIGGDSYGGICPEILMSVRIDNYRHISLARGDAAADAAREHVQALVRRLFNCRIVVPNGNSGFDAFVGGELIFGDAAGGGDFGPLMQSFQAVIAETPFLHAGRDVCVAVSAVACAPEPSESWEGCDVRLLPVAREALAAQPFGGLPPHPSVDGAAAYGADMELAGALLRALASHTALPGWCPVASTNASGRCLYAQAVPRFVDPAGQLVSGEAAVRAAERIGLARHVDRHMVALVLDALAADPLTTLGVEISAQSARQDSWWHDIGRRLDRDAGLARRLVIEISGASPLGVEHEVLAFVQAMRARGCRIALRNLGSGHASVRTLMALAPDIVKIDAFFLQAAIPSGKARALFGRIAGLAAALGGVIVAEGADSPELVAIAREDGIAWVQGGSAGGTVSMPGRAAPPVVFGDALIAAGYADFAASHAPAVNSVAPDRHGNRQARPLVRVAKQGGRA